MSERKVLNKYYPPDYDPTKIPKQKRNKNQTFDIRLMAPFNMRCNTCGEYIYKGKKFNSRKETVDNENYLGLYIFRFYIKCPRCVAEIAFKTDPENTDYILEAGATRNFEALRTAEKQALLEDKLKKAEEANNPMKLLENRTKASQNEMQLLETLEDLKQMNQLTKSVNTEEIIKKKNLDFEEIVKNQEMEDEEEIKSIYRNHIKRIADPGTKIDFNYIPPPPKKPKTTDTLTKNFVSSLIKIKPNKDQVNNSSTIASTIVQYSESSGSDNDS